MVQLVVTSYLNNDNAKVINRSFFNPVYYDFVCPSP